MQPREPLDCTGCRYFKRNAHSIVATGQCRHAAPLAVPVMQSGIPSIATVWPTVEANDWCGQWSPTVGEGIANG